MAGGGSCNEGGVRLTHLDWHSTGDGVPEIVQTSRCDGAFVYVRPGERRAALAGNQRTDRYPATPPDQRNRRRS